MDYGVKLAEQAIFSGGGGSALQYLASVDPEVNAVVAGIAKEAIGWSKLPKGWTQESVKKFWKSLTGQAKHKVTKCMKEMKGKFDDPGAFCASLADLVEGTTKWRGKKAMANHTAAGKKLTDKQKKDLISWLQSEGYGKGTATSEVGNLQEHGFNSLNPSVKRDMRKGLKWVHASTRTATGISLRRLKDGGHATFSSGGVYVHVWFDKMDAKNDFGGRGLAKEWQVIVSTSPDPLNLKPHGRELVRDTFRSVEPRADNSVIRMAEDFIKHSLFQYRNRVGSDLAAQRVASRYLQSFNKFNAPEVLGALFKALEKAGLDETASKLKKMGVSRVVNDAWGHRTR